MIKKMIVANILNTLSHGYLKIHYVENIQDHYNFIHISSLSLS